MKQTLAEVETGSRSDQVAHWDGHMNVGGVATSGPRSYATLDATTRELTLKGTLGEFKITPTSVCLTHL